MPLRIEIDRARPQTFTVEVGDDIECGGSFADATFLIEDRDDWHYLFDSHRLGEIAWLVDISSLT